ncbi:MAG TPA: IS110 family transposase [Verrucomicrobiae bacterium]
MKRPKKITEKLFAGLDLHGNNVMIAIINQDGKLVAHRKVECDLKQVCAFLKPFKPQLQSMAVESTFNWYWLVDGLRRQGYGIDLANPAKIEQYNGLKHVDDMDDAFHLAELQRLNILPKAHVYDPQLRPVRDLFRRRTLLVHQRTSLLLSFKSLHARTTGQALTLSQTKQLEPQAAAKLYEHPANQLIAQVEAEHMASLGASISRIEKTVLASAREIPLYDKLLTIPGIGKILGMTITMEVGDIKRFPSDGDFASYCRMVDARRLSNGKCKADNNQKCGNKYLSWAFVEAANFARRYDEACRRWYDRKAAKTSKVLATKALGCKLAKAAWHVMSQQCDYDPKRMFPDQAMKQT